MVGIYVQFFCFFLFRIMSDLIQVTTAPGFHLFPFRTEKLSPVTPMVLRNSGRVGSRRFSEEASVPNRTRGLHSFYHFCLCGSVCLSLSLCLSVSLSLSFSTLLSLFPSSSHAKIGGAVEQIGRRRESLVQPSFYSVLYIFGYRGCFYHLGGFLRPI